MKKIILCITMLVFGMVGSAIAGPMTWEDVIEWDPVKLNRNNPSVSYTHDITDGVDGFDPWLDGNFTFDLATDYLLTVTLYDDRDRRFWYESVYIDQAGFLGDTYQNTFSWENDVTGWSFWGLLEINAFGTLDVTVQRLAGDFYLASSKLVVNGYTSDPVPEPGTMLLFGTGLLGLLAYNRKRFSKKK